MARYDGTELKPIVPLPPAVAESLSSLPASPDWFPMHVHPDKDVFQMVKMSPAWYRQADFLDPPRIPGKLAVEIPGGFIRKTLNTPPARPCGIIFHTAFCGSTLLSRILEKVTSAFILREPRTFHSILHGQRRGTLSAAATADWTDTVLRLLCRTYSETHTAVAKLTDWSNGLMDVITRSRESSKSLFLYQSLPEFIIACVKHESRHPWIAGQYRSIAAFLQAENADRAQSIAEKAAGYWYFNLRSYREVAQKYPDRIGALNFRQLLEDAGAVARSVADWYGLNVDERRFDDKLQSVMGIYSKRAEQRYSPAQRQQEMHRLAREHASEVSQGLEFMESRVGNMTAFAELPNTLSTSLTGTTFSSDRPV